MMPVLSSPPALRVGVVLFPNVTERDVTDPYEIFAGLPSTRVYLVAETLDPVRSEHGLTIVPDVTFETAPALDVICVPGGAGAAAAMEDDEKLRRFLQKQPRHARYVTSVRTGPGVTAGIDLAFIAPALPDAARGEDILEGFVTRSRKAEGVAIHSLAPGTTLIVRTQNSQYRFVVLFERQRVLVKGGAAFPEATTVRLEGATAGGSALKVGWILVGFQIEMLVGSLQIRSSKVRSVSIESVPGRKSDTVS